MDTALLRSFLAVADLGSFSAAGERLSLSQSAVSHHVARLESLVGRRLFDRTTRRCDLTASGALLREQARDVIARIEGIRRQFRRDSMSGHLRLGVPDDAHLFAPLADTVRALALEQPLITLDLHAGLSHDIHTRVSAGDLDLGLVRDLAPDETSCLVASEPLVWIGDSAHAPNANRREVPLAVVAGPCLYQRAAREALRRAGVSFRIAVTCSSPSAVAAFVRSGVAVAVTLGALAPDPRQRLDHRHGMPPLPNTGLTFRHGGERPTAVAAWLMPRLAQAMRVAGA